MSNNPTSYDWASNSALFHITPGSIFVRDKLAFKVKKVLQEPIELCEILSNPERVKNIIFKTIQESYNRRINQKRINNTTLTFQRLTDTDINRLFLKKIKVSKTTDDNTKDCSGFFEIYPRTLVCSSCGTFYPFKSGVAPPAACACHSGKLEQISVVKFCKDCGKVDVLYPNCKACKKGGTIPGRMRLLRPNKDSILTWRWVCENGHEEDILQAYCDHKDSRLAQPFLLPDGTPSTKFKILTIRENSIFTPIVTTTVDIKDTRSIKINELETILFGIYLGKFDDFNSKANANNQTVLQLIDERYREYYAPSVKKAFYSAYRINNPTAKDEEIEEKFKKSYDMVQIRKIIDELSIHFPPDNYDKESFNNYSALKGIFDSTSNYKKYSDEASVDKYKFEKWNRMKEIFKIHEITYLEKIKLVSAAIGIVNGISKLEENYVPHFEPLWDDKKNKEYFSAYINPYETEGLLIDFNRDAIYKWLKENLSIQNPNNFSAAEFLMYMKENTPEYEAVKTLLHTLCHVLIKKSTLYTGIDSKSCSEMIFPNNGAILMYSTGNIKIGGFGHLFESFLIEFFEESDYELKQCIYDPACNSNEGSKGACFACLYLPEHVCHYYNKNLDRDVLNARIRYTTKFW